MAAVNKVHQDFECVCKFVHISVRYINDSHISFIHLRKMLLCLLLLLQPYDYSFHLYAIMNE
jgi:hypothetical protein